MDCYVWPRAKLVITGFLLRAWYGGRKRPSAFFFFLWIYQRKTSRYINLKWFDKAIYDWIWQVFGKINHNCVAGRPWKAKLCDIRRYDEWEIMISLATLKNPPYHVSCSLSFDQESNCIGSYWHLLGCVSVFVTFIVHRIFRCIPRKHTNLARTHASHSSSDPAPPLHRSTNTCSLFFLSRYSIWSAWHYASMKRRACRCRWSWFHPEQF